MKKFNKDLFDKQVDSTEFNTLLTNATLAMEGKDGYYTRNDAFKSGVMIAYYLLKMGDSILISKSGLNELMLKASQLDTLKETTNHQL